MLTIYGRTTSSNVQLVMWFIGELQLPHERLDYGHVYGGLDTPEFGALNPHRKIPVLKDGDLVVWESASILRYLAATYDDGGAFWPKDASERARIDKWAEWGKNELCNNFTVPIFWSRVRTAAANRDAGKLAAAISNFDAYMSILATQLGDQPFVCGQNLTTADIVIGHLLFRWFTMDIPRAENPRVEMYYQRLTERSAYREHVMVSYEPLRVEGA
ncbi:MULTISPECIES: glutathione S-transferase family protein [Roseovarius]|uniref:Glutathione S-transferase N-terminal domain-containing protein n=2 Tax=Roseovarius TaxID=74030 RepID=A0ABZ2HJ22_9RHOB|nr:glutathione S-transferase N-terminal domain-containing protein [Roseovarius sp. W115]MDV2928715.1 glutathione S-transferase N-terminal domain-containing protein [Roseovarius sp. W115]